MRKALLSLLLLLPVTLSLAATPSGMASDVSDWTLHLSYHNAQRCATAGHLVYTVTNGNLYAYDTRSGQVRYYNQLDGMGSKGIKDIGYSPEHDCLVIVYEDFHIDLLVNGGQTFIALPGVKNSNEDIGSPTSLFVGDDYAAVASTNGMAYLHLDERAVCAYVPWGERVYGAAVWHGHILLSTGSQLYHLSLADSPYDHNAWTLLRKGRINQFVPFCGRLYALVRDQADGTWISTGVHVLHEDGMGFDRIYSGAIWNMRTNESRAFLTGPRRIWEIRADDPLQVGFHQDITNTWGDGTPVGTDSLVWLADGWNGLTQHALGEEGIQPTDRAVEGVGPEYDYCYSMHYEGERLLIAGGQLFSTIMDYPGTLMEYTDGQWHFYQSDIEAVTGVRYENMTGLTIDPDDPSHAFATSRTGLYEFRDRKFENRYSVNNSPLRSPVTTASFERYVMTSAPVFDTAGNLWLLNDQIDTLLRVMQPDGTWGGIYVPEVDKAPTCEHMMLDTKGRLWLTSRRSVSNHNGGVLYVDYNGTAGNTRDDVVRYRSSLTNQDGTSTTLDAVYDIVQDMRGAIWIGTQHGVFEISDPDRWTESDMTAVQPKIPRNDGTNFADYLLNETPVTAIAVDGGNRKWLGTESSGLYLAAPDGSAILAHYDTGNSPLLSDHIYSLAVHPATGELMIGTDKGLCSLRTDITPAQPSLSENAVRVYPNPVRPEYHGRVTVAGLTDGADVRVMTSGGMAVAGGTAIGGSFLWDGCGTDGRRVAPGVYFFMVSTSDGNQGIVAKVVVI